ncbi:hypothetical protein GE09DRAFT_396265 [Coniochaeta sp. 2T2.1]|nr:hypothetical protein GE09DRAFT_396265 [Coniochaeta sp. 2T2.1]
MFVNTAACSSPCAVESSERARQREIAAYLSAASFPPDLPSGPLPDPILNADPTLNALVQLGAHRLGCDRAFLSFIDRQYQFVVAEITRSHSLNEKRCAPNEHIFLGVTKLDACWGVCPTTMKAFMDETGEWIRTGPNVIANPTRYIINDFTTEPGYTERPYVVNYPYFRSYLEVPLVSPLGYLLGSYCVVHNDLKDYNDDATVETMNEIAAAIMAHLELRRIQQSRDRSEQLIQGLSGFISAEEGPSQADAVREEARFSEDQRQSSNHPSLIEEPVGVLVSGDHKPLLNHASSSLQSSDSVSTPADQGSSETPPTTPRDDLEEDPFAALATEPPSSSTSGTEVHASGFISSANIKSTLYRAAVTIRQSMDMDGFMFLDAVPSSFVDRLASDDQGDPSQEDIVGPFCAAIVKSTASQQASHSSRTRLPEAALQRFIRRFPHGHIFSADEFGPIDEIYAPGKPWPVGRQTADLSGKPRPANADDVFRGDVSLLFRIIPDAKYIVFRPLWHFQQECWYAAALGWVANPTRAIDVGDISLVAAFGNSVMAEVSRLEALATSRAKSDFVSSISHELRSPLHGIMAGSELLREEMPHPLLDMIDSCGRTLLDIFNNLLEHAVVTSSGGRYRTTMDNVKMTDLGALVEDVLDVVHTSHLSENAFRSTEHRKGSFGLESLGGKGKGLLITFEVTKRWLLPVNTGAWKRIVMNVFSNALKYTESGSIKVTLKEAQPGVISFSVQDTGCGMSSDYLKYKLFMPFSQENTHSPGMGLGLSIVQQLASGLGGTVDVKSSVGVGTLVEVLVPVDTSVPNAFQSDQYEDQRRRLAGKTLCLVTQPRSERSEVVEQAFRANAGDNLGMKVILYEGTCPPADVYVVDEMTFTQTAPLVWLCKGPCSKKDRFHLHHPLGPRKLASVLFAAIEAGPQQTILQPALEADPLTIPLRAKEATDKQPVCGSAEAGLQLASLAIPSPAKDLSQAMSGKTYHLLVVDDNPINVKLLATVMRKLKHTFVTACNGREAVELYKESLGGKRLDMIFMDISMPVMDGFEATREIRRLESPANRCKIVALTGLSSEESRDEALASGSDVFLTKPIKLDAVRRVIRDELGE